MGDLHGLRRKAQIAVFLDGGNIFTLEYELPDRPITGE